MLTKKFLESRKKLLLPPLVGLALTLSVVGIVTAHGGDVSKIHACVSNLTGVPKIVGGNDGCAVNETALDWIKDVIAGTGLTSSTSSSGITLSLATGGVATSHIADSSVTTPKLDDAAVTAAKLLDGAITAAKLANNSVTTSKLADKAITQDKLSDELLSGWVTSNDTWTYASSTSFTIAGVDRTTIYSPGTKIKFTNNGSTKYGYVKSSTFATDTTVNLVENTDYSINNSSITNPYYSYTSNPQGFPGFFNISMSNITGFASISGYTFKMAVEGKSVHLVMDIQGGSNATTLTIPAPINTYPVDQYSMPIVVIDNSAHQASPGIIGFSTSGDGSTINVGKTLNSGQGNSFGGFTASSGKGVVGQFFYPIQ